MNAALRLLMRPTASTGLGDRLVRSASVRATGTSGTATFSGSPLDSTHLLVAVVVWANSSAITAPAGWTESATGGGSNGLTQVRVYARQGDGSVNSITLTGANNAKTIYLYAFQGYVSDVSAAGVGTNLSSGTTYTIPALGSPPAVVGVAIAAVGTQSAGDGTWSNGYGLAGSYPTSGAMHPGYKEYTGVGGSYGTVYTVSSALGSGRGILVVYQLV